VVSMKRLVADIIAGVGRQVDAEARAAKRGFDLAIGKGGFRDMRRAENDRVAARAASRGVVKLELSVFPDAPCRFAVSCLRGPAMS
jgi:hypothetical protein